MNITIIGAGNMGRGIGSLAAAGGHSVTFVDAKPEVAEKTASEVKASAGSTSSVKIATLQDVIPGDVVVLALRYGVTLEVAKQLGAKLAGKVVVDIANPLNATFDGLATASDSSSAEELEKVITKDAKVVKAFNTTFAGTLLKGQVGGQPLDVFIAGDDADAKAKVAQLISDGGLHPVDAGPLSRARQIEAMGFLHIVLQKSMGTNWGSTIKILA